MLSFKFLDARVTPDHIGLIPTFFTELDPRDAIEQINERYAHGGGWFDLRVGPKHFTLTSSGVLQYMGDEFEDPKRPIAEASLHGGICEPDAKGELILLYEGGYTVVVQVDGSFRVARLD